MFLPRVMQRISGLMLRAGKVGLQKMIRGEGAHDDAKPLTVALVGCGAVTKLYYTPALQELERLGQLQVASLLTHQIWQMQLRSSSVPAAVLVGKLMN